MAKVTVTPDPFVLVEYDSGALAALVEKVGEAGRRPRRRRHRRSRSTRRCPGRSSRPYVDVVGSGDGAKVSMWCSGGNFEHPQYPRRFDDAGGGGAARRRSPPRPPTASSPGFADAPADESLTERQREAWDTSAAGRISRFGFVVREPLVRYHFRLANGFGDGVDAVYERLWGADDITWAGLEAACAETAAADERPTPKGPTRRRGASLRR